MVTESYLQPYKIFPAIISILLKPIYNSIIYLRYLQILFLCTSVIFGAKLNFFSFLFSEEKKCPDIEKPCDSPGCKLEKDEVGCDICKCEPQCAPPKCKRWCKVKEVEGGCPVCECPKRRFGWKHKRD